METVPRKENVKTIKSKWVYNTKKGVDGNSITKFKARLVATVRATRRWAYLHYEQSFASVIKMGSVRAMFAFGSINNWKIRRYDVRSA